MKRISILLVAALAFVVNACERHSEAETRSALHAHADTDHGGAPAAHVPEHVHPKAEPLAPSAEVPRNPSGSAPADTHDPAKDKGTGGSGDPGAYKYFPDGGKKK